MTEPACQLVPGSAAASDPGSVSDLELASVADGGSALVSVAVSVWDQASDRAWTLVSE